MLEEMAAFFESRLDGYELHQLSCIDSAPEFYAFTAVCLPEGDCAEVLDLGCGTGLELEYYLRLNPGAGITGVDISAAMLKTLEAKFPGRRLDLIVGSYFEIPFPKAHFDAAVSVESLHHFTAEEKIPLYSKLRSSLKDGGFFILTDYFALSDGEEADHREELSRLIREEGLREDVSYHFDTPLTVEHEINALRSAGFSRAEVLRSWGATSTIRAVK